MSDQFKSVSKIMQNFYILNTPGVSLQKCLGFSRVSLAEKSAELLFFRDARAAWTSVGFSQTLLQKFQQIFQEHPCENRGLNHELINLNKLKKDERLMSWKMKKDESLISASWRSGLLMAHGWSNLQHEWPVAHEIRGLWPQGIKRQQVPGLFSWTKALFQINSRRNHWRWHQNYHRQCRTL